MSKLAQLSERGVSIWLDDLSRQRLESGNLADLIANHHVRGVTTNPSIFQNAIAKSDTYRPQIKELAQAGLSAEEIATELTTSDVRAACDLFHEIYTSSDGYDGRVSIEVNPRLAHNAKPTFDQAKELWEKVDRPNLMIKIPATIEGLKAITKATAAGISVNVTLIFSVSRYEEVIQAYLKGLEKAQAKGHDLSQIHSVASFFISRIDTEVDKRLEKMGAQSALAMRGRAGIANAQLAYGKFQEYFAGDRFAALAQQGANVQRPLWASTGVKNPDYPATQYVDRLIAPHTVNTMPEATLWQVKDNADLDQAIDVVAARNTLDRLVLLGIDFAQVTHELAEDGVDKFVVAWEELLDSISDAMQ